MKDTMTVLLIEEPGLLRNVVAKALTEWGCRVVTADDEDSVWYALASGFSPQIIVIDWFASFLDSDEFCRNARGMKALADVYMIVGIPRGGSSNIRNAMLAGANDFVYQPYDLDEIRVRLDIATRMIHYQSLPVITN